VVHLELLRVHLVERTLRIASFVQRVASLKSSRMESLLSKHSRARFRLCRVADPSVIVALGVSP
ncbi:MAG TPA: hypothetical protein VF062_26730, partial [Candidatus Limnocylindrales bacterium]